MRFYIQTLGCKINQYESQALREAWTARGWAECAGPGGAELILVHTCAVTAGASADSRQAVRRAHKDAPQAQVLVAGCASQVEPSSFQDMPGVAAVIPQAEKPGLRRYGESAAHADGPAVHGEGQPFAGPGQEGACAQAQAAWPAFAISSFHRARPILKVQDGCSHGCTYCIVPRARGGARSRPFEDIAAEAARLFASGRREVIVSGINLGQFALPDGDFWDMLARLEARLAPEWAGRARLRLSSLDPGMLGPRAIDVLAASRMVCPHLHLSMQSADESVLAAMGRTHYGAAGVLDFLTRLRTVWPVAALGADILTGFPGEPEEAFQATLDFCREARLSYAHVFPYSRRPGTVAARAKNQLPAGVRKERARRLRDVTDALERGFVEEVARLPSLTLAVEREAPLAGACEYYVECRMDAPSPVAAGELLTVRPGRVRETTLEVVTAG